MEIEAKFRLTQPVDAAQIEALDWSPYNLGTQRSLDQRDTFFDTPERALSQTLHAVRLRENGTTPVVTLKGPGTVADGVHSREELEQPTTDRAPQGWPEAIRTKLRDLIGEQPLAPLLAVRNNRYTWALQRAGVVVGEVALDRGEIIAGGRSQPMHELEIELKGGAASDLHAVQKLVLRQLPAVPENRSKFARGIALLTGTDVDETRLEKDQV